ncbi:MAG: hypothetical protein M3R50_05025 [Bacteroidota bacterium]|nr:hypothetical protein [Bacteroidota bacterium]
MKKLLLLLGVLSVSVATMFLETDKKKKKKKQFLDLEITGPGGEPVLIGANGGRYYFKNERKIYIRHKHED